MERSRSYSPGGTSRLWLAGFAAGGMALFAGWLAVRVLTWALEWATVTHSGPLGVVATEIGLGTFATPEMTPDAILPLNARVETVRVSHYWPPAGGTNCSAFVSGECVALMASGLDWREYIGRAAACPPEWAFGTVIVLPGGERFECLDRGGAIQYVDGLPWVDLLTAVPPVPFGALVAAQVIEP